MEYAERGDLEKRMAARKGRLFKEEEIWFFFIQILKGLAMLHKNKILH